MTLLTVSREKYNPPRLLLDAAFSEVSLSEAVLQPESSGIIHTQTIVLSERVVKRIVKGAARLLFVRWWLGDFRDTIRVGFDAGAEPTFSACCELEPHQQRWRLSGGLLSGFL